MIRFVKSSGSTAAHNKHLFNLAGVGYDPRMISDVDLLDSYSRAVISVVESVGPAVVGVSGVGTGMLITPDGYALTNSHVVSAVKAYELTLRDGSSLKAELVGTDPHTDLADPPPRQPLLPPRARQWSSDRPRRPPWARPARRAKEGRRPGQPGDPHHQRRRRPAAFPHRLAGRHSRRSASAARHRAAQADDHPGRAQKLIRIPSP